ncbi:MAG: hypothetical protein ACRDD4_06685 [Culicoidibacterales bacterium]
MGNTHQKLEQKLTEIINWSYEVALNGKGKFQSAQQLAKKYQTQAGLAQIEAIERLFADQLREAMTIGFVSGLGGVVTLPVTLPTNITLITLLQVRLSATVAILLGYDLRTSFTKISVLLALTGSSADELAHEVGLKIGLKVGEHTLESISEEVVTKITEKIGVRFAVLLGEAGLLGMETLLPFVGGAIDAALDRHIFKETQIAVWEIFLTPKT